MGGHCIPVDPMYLSWRGRQLGSTVKFILYKFCTMRDAADEHGQPLPAAQRLTALGRTLRSASLDEL